MILACKIESIQWFSTDFRRRKKKKNFRLSVSGQACLVFSEFPFQHVAPKKKKNTAGQPRSSRSSLFRQIKRESEKKKTRTIKEQTLRRDCVPSDDTLAMRDERYRVSSSGCSKEQQLDRAEPVGETSILQMTIWRIFPEKHFSGTSFQEYFQKILVH